LKDKETTKIKEIIALKVRQWLVEWNEVSWDPVERRTEPQHWFYQFSIPASYLKALSGIYPRSTKERSRGAEDLGIQRRHEPERSEEIARFVRYGYPWSELSEAKRKSSDNADLRKPGWLPTAIVVNLRQANDVWLNKRVESSDLIHVEDQPNGLARITLPKGFTGSEWKFKTIPPIEIIDGQHRLWAFEEEDLQGDFELPVVAFVGLDRSWQAYLFYIINIKPKKINASLAFDLYPLLRTEDWLTKFEGHIIYRETRAQELVDLLWSHKSSPWYKRINMLGEPGFKGLMVSQSAWIRSLLATYIKSWEGPGVRVGGLFGSPVGRQELTLPWSRLEQAAFLIVVGQCFRDAISESRAQWAKEIRRVRSGIFLEGNDDLAFYGPHTLINQDQGIRAFLYASNDLFYVKADALSLGSWGGRDDPKGKEEERVSKAIESLRKQTKIMGFLRNLSSALANFDWRASSDPGLTNDEALLKAAFRGSGGYKELRRYLLRHLSGERNGVSDAAKVVLKILGY